MRNILLWCSLLDTRVYPQFLFNLNPWNLKRISYIHPFKHFNKANTNANVFLSIFASHCSACHNYINIYTDFSKTNILAGHGIVCKNSTLSYCLPASFSVFSGEFLAVKIALKLIHSYSYNHFIIYTNYKSVLDLLQSNSYSLSFTGWPADLEFLETWKS